MKKHQKRVSSIWWYAFATVVVLSVTGTLLFFIMTKSVKTVTGVVRQSDNQNIIVKTSAYMTKKNAADATQAFFNKAADVVPFLPKRVCHDQKVSAATTLANTGQLAFRGKSISDGLFLRINRLNAEKGGIHSSFLFSLDQRNDGDNAIQTMNAVTEMIDGSSFFLSSLGDKALHDVYVPLLAQGKMALFFPVAGIRPLLKDEVPLVFFRPSYKQEIAALLHHAVQILKKDKIALFYEESEWGIEGKEIATKLLAHYQIVPVAITSYQPDSVVIQKAVDDIEKIQPHAVICIANGRPAYHFIREAMNKQLHYVSFLGISRLAAIADHLRTTRGADLIISSVVPNPLKSELPIVVEYRNDMRRYLPNKGLSTDSLEGYINSALCIEVLEKLSEKATVADVWRALTMLHTEWKGLFLNYQSRTLSHTVWIDEGAHHERWHEYVIKDVE